MKCRAWSGKEEHSTEQDLRLSQERNSISVSDKQELGRGIF